MSPKLSTFYLETKFGESKKLVLWWEGWKVILLPYSFLKHFQGVGMTFIMSSAIRSPFGWNLLCGGSTLADILGTLSLLRCPQSDTAQSRHWVPAQSQATILQQLCEKPMWSLGWPNVLHKLLLKPGVVSEHDPIAPSLSLVEELLKCHVT